MTQPLRITRIYSFIVFAKPKPDPGSHLQLAEDHVKQLYSFLARVTKGKTQSISLKEGDEDKIPMMLNGIMDYVLFESEEHLDLFKLDKDTTCANEKESPHRLVKEGDNWIWSSSKDGAYFGYRIIPQDTSVPIGRRYFIGAYSPADGLESEQSTAHYE